MTIYQLHLESGPQKKKTMVHVPELLGCVATGPTTALALAKTPHIIHSYLNLLQRHGTPVDSNEEIQIQVAEHIMEGSWLGNGDPSILFLSDLEPLTTETMEIYIQRSEWIRAEIVDLVSPLSDAQWQEQPQPHGRAIRAILEHIFGSEYSYIRSFGKLDGVAGPGKIENMHRADLLEWMGYVRARELEKLRSLDDQTRSKQSIHGSQIKTAHKTMRRMLEHEWEHLVELQERLQKPSP